MIKQINLYEFITKKAKIYALSHFDVLKKLKINRRFIRTFTAGLKKQLNGIRIENALNKKNHVDV